MQKREFFARKKFQKNDPENFGKMYISVFGACIQLNHFRTEMGRMVFAEKEGRYLQSPPPRSAPLSAVSRTIRLAAAVSVAL